MLQQSLWGEGPFDVLPRQGIRWIPVAVHVVIQRRQLPFKLFESPPVAPQRFAKVPRQLQDLSHPPIPSRDEGLDHGPAIAFRAQLHPQGTQMFLEKLQFFLGLGIHPVPLKRGVGFGHKGAAPQR